jgi:hypothetical protein
MMRSMGGSCAAWAVAVLLWTGSPAAAQPSKPPAYFGAPDGAFNDKTLTIPKPKPAPAPAPAPAAKPVEEALFPVPAPPPKVWSGSVDLGLNGATGNSELFNLRAGFTANRKTAENLFTSNFLYQYATQSGAVTQQQALFNARDEVLFPGSPWSLFASTNIEYDEFRAFDFIVGVYAGVGYAVVDTEKVVWKLRGGAGASRQVGGPRDLWVPEGILGTDFAYRFNERQSFVATVDYYPDLQSFSRYRVRARAAYEIVIDPESGMALRLGVQERYDSNPGTARPSDFNYFAALGFNF